MLNSVSLVGRLTKDPTISYTPNQTAVAKFTLAVTRTFKKEGQPESDFIPIVVWGKPAENCGKYISKGRLVAVSGRLQTRSWDGQDGKRNYATEVIAAEVSFLDKGTSDNNINTEHDGFNPVDKCPGCGENINTCSCLPF